VAEKVGEKAGEKAGEKGTLAARRKAAAALSEEEKRAKVAQWMKHVAQRPAVQKAVQAEHYKKVGAPPSHTSRNSGLCLLELRGATGVPQ
jgi:hypothetical protein